MKAIPAEVNPLDPPTRAQQVLGRGDRVLHPLHGSGTVENVHRGHAYVVFDQAPRFRAGAKDCHCPIYDLHPVRKP